MDNNNAKKKRNPCKAISVDMLLWCPLCKETTPHKRITNNNTINPRSHNEQLTREDKVKCQNCGLCTIFITSVNWKGISTRRSEKVMNITPESYYHQIMQNLFTPIETLKNEYSHLVKCRSPLTGRYIKNLGGI